MPIDERALRVLEFYKIRAMLADQARSVMGRDLAGGLLPSDQFEKVSALLEETGEAESILYYLGSHPVGDFEDVRGQLTRAQAGATLGMKDLMHIASSLRMAGEVKSVLVKKDDEQGGSVRDRARAITPFLDVEGEISRCILSEEEMSDQASPELGQIRRQIRILNDKVREKLNSYLHNTQFQKYLQESIITIRNDRYVLPVKQESRQFVAGLVHDQSQSGATVFVEPMAVVEINNEIKQWAAREREEVERILRQLSAMVAPHAAAIASNLLLMAELDFVFAKAALSRAMRAVAPRLNQRGYIRIVRGRHPLISPETVVPSDIWIGEGFTALLITGPNTGGKTVTLKLVGLLTLMAQAGLFVPADPGTEMAVFDQVHADIGDEQSIEQSLSTFSSHMTNIVRILENVDERSLVLLDELGAGTDPTEGAALAISILETLHHKKVRALATTHYSELKEFALTKEGVENASVEFDVETLRPTYRLSIGIPGRSNAFLISLRLGLSEGIIDRARDLISEEKLHFEEVISSAESQRQIAERERALAEQARQEMNALREQAERQRKELEQQRDKLMRQAREDARRVLMQARAQSEEIIRELRRLEKETASASLVEREIQQKRQQLKDGLDDLSSVEETMRIPDEKRDLKPPENLRPGETVRLLHLDKTGTVLFGPDARGEVQLQVGILKLNAHISNLRREKEQETVKSAPTKREITIRQSDAGLSLDLRGQTLDEAILNLDKYLDDAFLNGFNEVSIIHGKGTGALRAGIQQHLRKHPHAKGFRIGKYGEGESGVTVVELK